MSLIIAKILDGKLYVESDTKITDDLILRNDPLKGMLKILVLEYRLCMCYAGNIDYAIKAYNHFVEKAKTSIEWNEFSKFLLSLHIESELNTDFILAGLIDGNPFIKEIKNGKIAETLSSWIGDKKTFSKFQEYYNESKQDQNQNGVYFNKIFNKIMSEEISEYVGDFQISVYTDVESAISNITGKPIPMLRYLENASLYSDREVIITEEDGNNYNKMPSGSVYEGSYQMGVFVSITPENPCTAIHIGYANCTLFFPPNNLLEGIIYRNMNAEEFIESVFLDYRVKLLGFGVYKDGFGLKMFIGGENKNE